MEDIKEILSRSSHDWLSAPCSQLCWPLENSIIYLTKHGSHAYGTATESSDLDVRGACIPPKRYYLGTLDRFEQFISANEKVDLVLFGLNKFVQLAICGNPNSCELLFTDESDHLFVSPIFEPILNIKEDFLSKRLRYSMAGYSFSQLKRIKLHRRYILNPPKKKPERADFGLPDNHKLIPEHQLLEIEAAIRKLLDSWIVDTTGMDDDVAIKFKNELHDVLVELRVNHDDMDLYAARCLGLNDNLTEEFKKERSYKAAQREYKQYEEWKLNRNKERYELEEKYGYDCYVEETEFLTKNGWKKYDEITENDLLATVNAEKNPRTRTDNLKHRKFLSVEYQKYTERYEGLFTGNLYNLVGYHVDVMVTPNHRMLVRKVSRRLNKTFDKLELVEISNIYDCFDIVRQITPRIKNYCLKKYFRGINISYRDYLMLMGWYLSDGTINVRKNKKSKKPVAINISQEDNGKLTNLMCSFYNRYKNKIKVSKYRYLRTPNEFRPYEAYENILSVRDKAIVNKLDKECGSLKEKRIPRWVFGLSRDLMEILLDALMGGDGTLNRPDNSMIYYSSLKGLADDVQELAFMCGFETSLYGPYTRIYNGREVNMHQVHINKTREQYKRFVRNQAIRKEQVKNKRIVCFTVPNSTLITKYNGHIGIHGNSKHGMHLVRLLRMCKELLETCKLNVKRSDAEELLTIRNGAWTYDQLIEWADVQNKELDVLYKTSKLRNEPNRTKINNVLINMTEEFLFKGRKQ